tara:strand:- start:24 stop:182 length:159 start_codon:yes stop_codon:yes gene_type:complete
MNFSRKDDCKTTNQNAEGNYEKWKNLELIVIHEIGNFINTNKLKGDTRNKKK